MAPKGVTGVKKEGGEESTLFNETNRIIKKTKYKTFKLTYFDSTGSSVSERLQNLPRNLPLVQKIVYVFRPSAPRRNPGRSRDSGQHLQD